MLRVGSKVCNHIKNSILLSEVHEMLTEAGLREGTSDRRGGSWWQLRIVFRAGESTWKWGGHSERHVQVSCEGRRTKAKRCRGLDRGCVWTVGFFRCGSSSQCCSLPATGHASPWESQSRERPSATSATLGQRRLPEKVSFPRPYIHQGVRDSIALEHMG